MSKRQRSKRDIAMRVLCDRCRRVFKVPMRSIPSFDGAAPKHKCKRRS